jgi:hypothetical protein
LAKRKLDGSDFWICKNLKGGLSELLPISVNTVVIELVADPRGWIKSVDSLTVSPAWNWSGGRNCGRNWWKEEF